MSVIPGNSPEPVQSAAGALPPKAPLRLLWPQRHIWLILFAVFTFEIGLFLVAFPWMDYWSLNHFPSFVPFLEDYWDDPYFKGAISGLGGVNLFISLRQIVNLIRRRASA